MLDYGHIIVRLPEIAQELEEQDDLELEAELDELIRSVPRLIGILPDVLRDRSDVRHNAAVSEMVAGLVKSVDKVRPLALVGFHRLPVELLGTNWDIFKGRDSANACG